MLGNFPPFTTMQELNLDWILTKIKNILRFVPDDGAVGQILRRTPSGAEWSNEQGGGGAVNSVNGQTGDVVLTAADVGALPDSTTIPTNTSDLNNDSGFITAAQAPVQSVNGQTGSVTITVPTKTSDLNNDSGFITAAQAPVQSVNGMTGAVTVPTNTPTEVSITLNTADWIVNNTACYRIGNLVLVRFYVQGTPASNVRVATGLPIPVSPPQTVSGASSQTVLRIGTTGDLYIQLAGNGTYTGGTIVYMTT